MDAEDLIKNLKNSDYKKNCKKINIAWNFAQNAHKGQYRGTVRATLHILFQLLKFFLI